jgi:hypothetical protein
MSSIYGDLGQYRNRGATGGGAGHRIPEGYQYGQLQQFTPEQMQLFQRMFGQIGPESFLAQLAGGNPEAFAQAEAPALRQFGELQGGLASRFSGMGGLGGRKSSGFQNTMSAASSDFAQQLQSKRMDLQRQALKDLFGMQESLLGQRPYDRFLTEEPPSFWESLMGGLAGMGGSLLGGLGGGIGSKW